VRKVSKQVALAFVKRTLARCRKFEDTGVSCFSEPALQDIIFSVSPCNNDTKSVDCVGSGTASNTCNEASHQAEARGSGMSSGIFTCSFMMAIMPFVIFYSRKSYILEISGLGIVAFFFCFFF